jgi:hypothetical protein
MSGPRWRTVALGFTLCFAGGGADPASAQDPATATFQVGTDTVTAKPRMSYPAGWFHRTFLGANNRALWDLSFSAPLLDLDLFAGGLTVTERGGGQQTASLGFLGADGQEYRFRSIDKDASRTLDPELRNTIAARVLQDQISALMPLASSVVWPLVNAAGVLQARPYLAVMPDDPRLGEFREEFSGLVGFVEVRPDEGPGESEGFAGSDRVVGSDRFFERIEERQDEIPDPVAFLRARSIDFLVGDWDRHPDQWRWASTPTPAGGRLWAPVARDRDWALARIGGFFPWIARFPFPQYVGFDRDYPSAFNLSWSGRALDRLILPALDWPGWEATITDVQGRLTDDVIGGAVATLPASYRELIGDDLTGALIHRRDGLLDLARDFYELLAEEVDVYASDDEDVAVVDLLHEDSLRVRLFPMDEDGGPSGAPFFDRTFRTADTREVRIFLLGDDDRAIVQGEANPGIKVRVVGGGSDDQLEDRSVGGGKRIYFYDHRGDNSFEPGEGTRVEEARYTEPEQSEDAIAPPRDWGRRWLPIPRLRIDSESGVIVGLSGVRTRYGFRQYPFLSRLELTGAIGSTTGGLFLAADYDFPVYRQSIRGSVTGIWNGVEAVDFFGFGNETENVEDDDVYRARQAKGEVRATLDWRPLPELVLAAGPLLELFRPAMDENEGTVVDDLMPYGYSDFNQVGAVWEAAWDRRDATVATRRGSLVRVQGRHFLPVADVEESFSVLDAQAMAFLSADLPGRPVLALRLGGTRTWGKVPFHHAAYIGGSPDVRGFRRNRFAGNSAVYGNGELRFFLRRFFILLPLDLGIHVLGDTGRVWFEGEDSDRWHSNWGGGVWSSVVSDAATVSLSVARSTEATRFYFRYGFLF